MCVYLSCSYESTSSDNSSSESSDEGSDSSEYHEAREKLPESAIQNQQTTQSNSVPQQTAVQPPAIIPDSQSSHNLLQTADTALPDQELHPPATDGALQTCASQTPDYDLPLPPPPPEESMETLSEQTVTSASSNTESVLDQSSVSSSVTCSTSLCATSTTEQLTVQSETSQTPPQPAAATTESSAQVR